MDSNCLYVCLDTNPKRPQKLLTKYNSLDSKEPTTGAKEPGEETARTALTPSPAHESKLPTMTASSSSSSSRSSLKPKINHHSIKPAQEPDASGSVNETVAKSNPSIAVAKSSQPTLTASFSSNQLNSVKSVQNSQFDSSRSGSITSIMYAKSKLSSGYRYF